MTEQPINFGQLPHSVKISINAKMQMSGEVKVYGSTVDEAYNIAFAKAQELIARINEQNNGGQ